ncbi:MAG: YbaB/EbfC family nucleoid-associated protein [Chloroflexi bacterium AL-W]|nr:YbaB/EbfC family nucleoid-associated protein [Chloroflexi bacterium AL-N1]NOK70918.1 YbaB/EbfC family nucleoid-associated protein [Chloroflexi bacterium AL-N10]NOK78587.1 YbaB/EbfC family nucleoid-associated protein [Chloroflexi bacterium AL-N5]NOK85819.1 YbaB/EbfC family nucleoid-associated protein [Chloroflexi bacterium AL-W]NOK92735.1 YbaB/EbfC family nucleoid-associated protein [Chloroflexi bacterium AL-N15]
MNPKQLQQMAQQMQRQMAKIQEELAEESIEGSAGSYVTVTMNGHREVKSIKIAPEVIDPEDIETLEDLVLTAINDASKKAQELAEQRLGPLTGGMNLPGMF